MLAYVCACACMCAQEGGCRRGLGSSSAHTAGSAGAYSRYTTNISSVRCMTFMHSRDSMNTPVFVACLLCMLAHVHVHMCVGGRMQEGPR